MQVEENPLIVCDAAVEASFAPDLPSTRVFAAMKRGSVKARPAELGSAAGAAHTDESGHAADFVLYSRGLVLEGDCATFVVGDLHLSWSEPQRAVGRVPEKRQLQMSVWKRRGHARTVPGKAE